MSPCEMLYLHVHLVSLYQIPSNTVQFIYNSMLLYYIIQSSIYYVFNEVSDTNRQYIHRTYSIHICKVENFNINVLANVLLITAEKESTSSLRTDFSSLFCDDMTPVSLWFRALFSYACVCAPLFSFLLYRP